MEATNETPILTNTKSGCDYEGHEFGAHYPDSRCIKGYLWDMDSGDASDEGWVYTNGGDIPCPMCNHDEWLEYIGDSVWSAGSYAGENEKATEDDFPKVRFAQDEEKLKERWLSGFHEARNVLLLARIAALESALAARDAEIAALKGSGEGMPHNIVIYQRKAEIPETLEVRHVEPDKHTNQEPDPVYYIRADVAQDRERKARKEAWAECKATMLEACNEEVRENSEEVRGECSRAMLGGSIYVRNRVERIPNPHAQEAPDGR